MQQRLDRATLVQKGLKALANHRPDIALTTLREAVDTIPPACSEELSKALYWLSVALLRLDQKELAIKSLASAQKIRRRGFARRVYLRNINEYGMPRQPTAELDDLYAFMSIQMSTYLVKRPGRKFESFSEREAILKILLDGWKILKNSEEFQSGDCGEKLFAFRTFKPRFPDFGFSGTASRLVRASFGRQGACDTTSPATRADLTRRCSCGSGLSFSRCCGRVQGLREI
ncbi:MAG: hypothetical protein FD137_126 [Spirochaetes bacterium]|nr:MAG: hypothetical protein FD137_126 [Spirochaetota bacterium]